MDKSDLTFIFFPQLSSVIGSEDVVLIHECEDKHQFLDNMNFTKETSKQCIYEPTRIQLIQPYARTRCNVEMFRYFVFNFVVISRSLSHLICNHFSRKVVLQTRIFLLVREKWLTRKKSEFTEPLFQDNFSTLFQKSGCRING